MTTAAPDYQQKPVTLLKDASIEAISLVDKGANGHSFFLFKRASNFVDPDGHMHFEHPASEAVVKQSPFLVGGETDKNGKKNWKVAYSVVAVPGEVDIQKDVWDEEGIREAAHNFLRKNSAIINYMHRDLDKVGDLVESAIAPADFKVGDTVIKAGSWYIGVEPNENLRKQIEAGEITGVSVQGSSKRIAVDPNAKFDTSGPRPVMKGDLEVPDKFGNSGQLAAEDADKDYDNFDYHHVPMGAEGPGIKKLQKLLNIPATGVYDEDTEEAFVRYLEEKHPEAEPEPTLENLKAVLARAKDDQREEEPVAMAPEAPVAPAVPEVEKDADMVDHGEVNGFDPGEGMVGSESTTPKIGPMIGNLGVGMKLTTESSSEDLKVALYQAYKQGDADLIAYAKTRYGINSAEHLLNKDLDHEALWFMYSRLVRNADPVEDMEAGQVDREEAKPVQEVEKANPVTTQPSFTPRESLDDDAGERISKAVFDKMTPEEQNAYLWGRKVVKAVFVGDETCEKCVALPMEKACEDHEIEKANGWMPEGISEADLNNSDYAWLADKFKHGRVSASEGRKLPYKVYGKVHPKGWKAAWSMAAKADLHGGPSLQEVRTKLLRDIPKGVKVDRSLLKSAMFDIDSHGLARFTDKNGVEVYAGTVVKLPGGGVAEVSSVEDESGANIANIVKVTTVRADKDGNEIVEDWKPKQLAAVTAVVKSATARAGGSMGGHDPRKYGKIKFIVRSFGEWAGGKHSICVERMKAEHPEVFKGNEDAGCAWLKDQWLGRTDWRGKDKKLAKGDSPFANYLNAGLLLKSAGVEGIMSDDAVDSAFAAVCDELGVDSIDATQELEKDADGFLTTLFGDDMSEVATSELNDSEQSMLQKFAAFLKGERLEKSVEAPERTKVTAGDLDAVFEALKLGVRDALEGGEGEKEQDLQAVVEDFGRYVAENLAGADFVEGEAEGDEESAPEATDNDVDKTGDVNVEAEPAALEPRKKKKTLLTSDSNMEENMEKSTDLTASRERLVAEAGTFASEQVEVEAVADTETVEKEAPVEGEEAHTLSLNDVALFADKLADGLDELRSQFGGIEKSLGSKLDSIGDLAKSLDISDRITAIEESIAELKGGTASETVEEVAKRVANLEAQPGHSTQAVEQAQREVVEKSAPILFAGKF